MSAKNTASKIAYFIYSTEELEILLPDINSSVEGYNIVVFDTSVEIELTKLNISYSASKDYISDPESHKLDDKSRATYNKINSFLEHEYPNIYMKKDDNLFEILRFDLERKLKDILVYSNVIEKFLKENDPYEIKFVLNDSIQSIVTEHILIQKKVEFTVVKSEHKTGLIDQLNEFKHQRKSWMKNNIAYFNRASNKDMDNDQNNKNKVLLIMYSRSHLNQLLPVAIEINKIHSLKSKAIMVNDLEIAEELSENNIDFNIFSSYSSKISSEKIIKKVKDIKKNWLELENNDDFKNIFNIKDINYWDIMKDHLEDVFTVQLPNWIRTYYAAIDLIEAEEPSLIVFTYDAMPHEKSIILSSRFNNTPTLEVQHGVTNVDIGFVPLYTDKVAVFGENSKQFFIGYGIDENRIEITGRPLYDSWTKDSKKNSEVLKHPDIPKEGRIILMATSALFHHRLDTFNNIKNMYSSVVKTVRQFPDHTLVIKLHPSEDVDNYRYATEDPDNVIFVKDIGLTELINRSDMVITDISTIGLEAIMLGMPVITLNYTDKKDAMPYASSGAAIGVYKPDDLKEAIDKILHDEDTQRTLEESRKQFLQDYLYKLDGRSSERVARLIEKMIDENQSAKDL